MPSLAFATLLTWQHARLPVVPPPAAAGRQVAGRSPLAAACAGIARHDLPGQ
jgi:hypothetical protein